MLTTVLLYSLLLTSAISMLLVANPITSVLFLIIVFLTATLILLSVGIDFIGLLMLVIYAGAIAVLFLFVIMVVPLKKGNRDSFTYLLISSIFFITLALQAVLFFSTTTIIYIPEYIGFNLNS
jgi:NADH-quinone oxidoreductase subunit J